MHPITGHTHFNVATLVSCLFLASGSALAHIKNEATQFPDIEFSDARFDIVVLVGAGIIPETPVFEPDKTLSMSELATWVALAEGLQPGGENPDVTELAAMSLQQGYVDTLAGDARLADLNRLFFDGQLALEDADRSPTKAEAARLIATQLDTAAGQALLEKRGLVSATGGEVTEVATKEGHHGNAYVVTIGDSTLEMDAHGRVANGPTDLLQWQGRVIRRAFVRGSGHHALWLYLEAEPLQQAVVAAVPVVAADGPADAPAAAAAAPDRRMLYWLSAAVVILGMVLFFRRRRRD